MIPYFTLTTFSIGPIPVQVWGLFVATGMLVGTIFAGWLAKKRGLYSELIWDLSFWSLLASFVGARLVHVLFYDFVTYATDPLEILRVWHGGYSSVGGMIGATLVGLWLLKRAKVDVWKYTDTAIFGLPIGLGIGRIGCFLIHDHPGTLTDFALAVQYPNGAVRHDLGLYLSINGFLLFAIFLLLLKRGVKTGTFVIVFLIWYGLTRFGLDFLRATNGAIVDTRYAGLTPAQYVSLGMIFFGSFLIYKKFWKK